MEVGTGPSTNVPFPCWTSIPSPQELLISILTPPLSIYRAGLPGDPYLIGPIHRSGAIYVLCLLCLQ